MGFPETLALCFIQARLRSSATDPNAFGQRTCTSTRFWTQLGLRRRQFEEYSGSHSWEVQTAGSHWWLFSGHTLEQPGELGRNHPGPTPRGSNSVLWGSDMSSCWVLSSAGFQMALIYIQGLRITGAYAVCDFRMQWDTLVHHVILKSSQSVNDTCRVITTDGLGLQTRLNFLTSWSLVLSAVK